jgi:hypothetical protein
MKIAILFAPKFTSFGVDIINQIAARSDIKEIVGYCTCSERDIIKVAKGLRKYNNQLTDIEQLEKEWINASIDWPTLQRIEAACGPSVVGQIIVSDRRIGSIFVKGGRTRPSYIKDLVTRDPQIAPLRYVSGLLKFLFDNLNNKRPDFVFCYTVAGAFSFALEKVCNALNIPFYTITRPRIDNLHCIETSSSGRNPRFVQSFKQFCHENIDNNSKAYHLAHAYLKKIRSGNEAYPHIDHHTEKILLMFAKAALKIAFASWRYWPNWQKQNEYIKRNYWLIMKLLRKSKLSDYFDSVSDIQGDYYYFPLHVEPEASTMVRSPLLLDQVFIIEQLAKVSPSSVQIVVKEHEPMLGLRPAGFYEALKKIPKVILLEPNISSNNLMLGSRLVCTITGTAAWEAALRAVPSIVLGEFPYTWLQGISEVNISNRLAEAVAHAVASAPAADDSLLRLLTFAYEYCFAFDDQLLWGDYSQFDENTQLCGAKLVAGEVLECHKSLASQLEAASQT